MWVAESAVRRESPAEVMATELCPSWVVRILAGKLRTEPQKGTAAQRQLVARATQYIADRPGERARLTDVGRELDVSPIYLTEVFRMVEGVPFYRYMLRRRLEHAVRLLPTYPFDLSRLALELGFSSHSHFTTAFGQAFSCTPAAFRNRGRRVCERLSSLVSQPA